MGKYFGLVLDAEVGLETEEEHGGTYRILEMEEENELVEGVLL